MSDPNAPDEPPGDAAADPVDRAYAQAEAMLRDEAERAARRARVLAAVAAAPAAADPEPAPAAVALPPPRQALQKPAPWLMAAGVAGVAALVGLRIAPTAVERPTPAQSAPPAPASAPPEARAAKDAAPPPSTKTTPAAPAASMAKSPPPRPLPPSPAPVTPARPRLAADAPAEPPPPLPIPPVERRVETPAPPAMSAAPPPAPLAPPPVQRRVETPALSAAIGPARDEARGALVIAKPDWARRPSDDDIAQSYPERARRTGINGRATIACTVTARRTLAGCAVVGETPEGYGFGEAALRLSRIYRMKPKTDDGVPVEGGAVRVPIVFRARE